MYKGISNKEEEYDNKIKEFEAFLKKLLFQYKTLRKQLKGLIEIKDT